MRIHALENDQEDGNMKEMIMMRRKRMRRTIIMMMMTMMMILLLPENTLCLSYHFLANG